MSFFLIYDKEVVVIPKVRLILGADFPERAIDKLSSFQGNNAVNARDHWRALMNVVKINGVRHQDVLMKFFVFSLE